jgi:hypothetical protein
MHELLAACCRCNVVILVVWSLYFEFLVTVFWHLSTFLLAVVDAIFKDADSSTSCSQLMFVGLLCEPLQEIV